ncbi:MAG: CBS domain-containing protein [Actinomycetota bacterium]
MAKVRDLMTRDPVCVSADAPVIDAARLMKDAGIGDVIVVTDGNEMCGIVTDRDIAVRAVAMGGDPKSMKIGEICSSDIVTVTPQDDDKKAVRLMRERAVRRLPVVDGKKAVGVVSIGDLALEKDPSSALADISASPPNT